MFWTLIKKEIHDHILSTRFAVSMVLALIFLIGSTAMLSVDKTWAGRQLYTGYKLKDYLYTNKYSWYWMNRDLPTLRVLATGLDEELSLNANSEAIWGPQFENNRQYVHNPNRYLFSQLDFVFFFSVIGSLLAFVFTYDAISGEHHRGTLRLLLINPISRPLLLTAKFLGSYLSLITSLLPALVSVILLLYLMPNVHLRPSDWAATLFLFLLALLYLSVFCALGLFGSCATKHPKTTLTILMTLWVAIVLVIPNFSPFLAAYLRPIPTVHEVQRNIWELGRVINQQGREDIENFIQEHGGDREALSDVEMRVINQIHAEVERKEMNLSVGKVAEIRQDFINEVEAQADLNLSMSLISPSAAFVYLATDVANTGILSEWDFRRAVIRYRSQYAEHVNSYIDETGDYQILHRILKADPPDFVPPKFFLSDVISMHFDLLVVLLLYSVVFFFTGQILFIRRPLT